MTEQAQDLTVTLLQTNLNWEDPVANTSMLTEKIRSIQEKTDLIVLPEMFTTGFTMQAERFAEKSHGTTYSWLLQLAAEKQAAITGSIIVQENGQFFNRLLWAQPDGRIFHYDKKHLFRMAQENAIYSAEKGNAGDLERLAHLSAYLLRPALSGVEPLAIGPALRPAALRCQLAGQTECRLAGSFTGPRRRKFKLLPGRKPGGLRRQRHWV